jgi:putative ABC transport system ATP-binding protein
VSGATSGNPTAGMQTRRSLRSDAPSAPSSLLRCENVRKSYHLAGQDIPALRGVDLAIDQPGYYAIMGQSGSGKSTLLHLLAALDKPDQGQVVVAGKAIGSLSEQEATLFRRREIGIVFQQFNLIPTLTARENVELPGVLSGEPSDQLRARSDELLERLGLDGRADHRPDALSGGEQQRVAIARALLFSPQVLFADEPTGNLDSATSAKLWRLLADLAQERSMLVLMVTHEPAAAVNCQKIFVLHDGRVTSTIDTEGLDAAGVASRYQQSVRAG